MIHGGFFLLATRNAVNIISGGHFPPKSISPRSVLIVLSTLIVLYLETIYVKKSVKVDPQKARIKAQIKTIADSVLLSLFMRSSGQVHFDHTNCK